MGNRFLKGAMILSISMLATRILGIVYIMPFQYFVKSQGLGLYMYAYLAYSLLLNLSTLGVPVGIAKFISKYNAKEEYDTSRKIFHYGLVFMAVLGVLGFFALDMIAPWYAAHVLARDNNVENYYTVEQVATAIRYVRWALLVIPPMAIFRGFFQGNQNMVPTAVSQFIEQLVRVILIVSGSFVIIRVLGRSEYTAVYFSVFTAFLAGISAFVVLLFFWFKNKKHFDRLRDKSVPHEKRDFLHLFAELISYAIPFAILGMATSLFQMVDTMTFLNYLGRYGIYGDEAATLWGLLSGSLNKFIMIPVAFAIAFGQPLVPELTHHLAKGNRSEIRRVLIMAIQLVCFITIPAVVGISMLGGPIFLSFFTVESVQEAAWGGSIFTTGAFIGLMMALYSIITSIMQGIGAQYKGIVFLFLALGVKYVFNIALIPVFGVDGAIAATMLAYGFCIVLSLYVIWRKTRFSIVRLFKRLIPIVIFTAIMAVVVAIVRVGLNQVLDYTAGSLQAIIYVGIAGVTGAAVYFGLAMYFDLFKAFGFNVSFKTIKKRLSRK